ncbi:MAG: oligosaccharide flippase family protein [Flavobacterium sp.]|uniref:lipopolysaccharide biosynthesis protein n=1 Tax=Flavobacterium sp. TaxID=239 RepID=UPI00261EBE94|nr:oligosaccharide flippase family protein [Flavobacterium sp.]MDD5151332.1 oligosaccharide flippase family protein [Flavobacterium sp.]
MSNSIILKNSFILYIRLLVTSILGIITARVLLDSLGVEDFGLYAVVSGVVMMISLLNTVLISTSFRFIAFELGKGQDGDVNKIFNISLALHLSMAVILLLLAETVGIYYIENYLKVAVGRMDAAIFVFRLSVYAAIFAIISIPFQALITAKENFKIRALIEIVTATAKLVAAYFLLSYSGDRLLFYAILILCATVLGPIAFTVYCKINYKKFTYFKISKDWKVYKEFFSFSSWIMFGAGASVGKVQGTALIINAFFGTALNASFGLANQLNTFVLMFAQNVGQAAVPQITKSYSAGNIERTKTLTAVISKFSFFLMLIPAIPILFQTEFILKLWLKELPEYLIVFSQLMVINALIDSSVSGLPAAIQATGKIKIFQIILSSNLLLALPISYLFFYFNFPPQTILFVFIAVSLVNNIIAQFFLKLTIGFDIKDYFKRVYLGIIGVGILVSPMYFLVDWFKKDLLSLLLFSMISTGWVIITIYIVGLTVNEKLEVKEIILKTKRRFKSNV